jgi:hypothetical protein
MLRVCTSLAVLLLVIFLPNLAQADENDLLRQITIPSAEATPNCKSISSSINPAVDFTAFTQDSQQRTDFNYCGSCSPSPCAGLQRGTICGYDNNLGLYKRCEMTYGNSCPADNLVVCYCYAEDIP